MFATSNLKHKTSLSYLLRCIDVALKIFYQIQEETVKTHSEKDCHATVFVSYPYVLIAGSIMKNRFCYFFLLSTYLTLQKESILKVCLIL